MSTVVAVHDGHFHADEVFAAAVLQRVFGPSLEIIRTRIPKILHAVDMRVDVGGRYDPELGDFDHHLPASAGQRVNGIPYAAFGLIWKKFGPQVCGSTEAAEVVDWRLVQGLDAMDCGVKLIEKETIRGVYALHLSNVIASFLPTDFEQDRDIESAFFEAVRLASTVLDRAIVHAQAQVKAKTVVRKALEQAADPRVLVLECECPWQAIVIREAPEVLYVICLRRDGRWNLEAVRQKADDFAVRRPLPAAWGGKDNNVLPKITGVPAAFFCHEKLFKAVARSCEGALALARLALSE